MHLPISAHAINCHENVLNANIQMFRGDRDKIKMDRKESKESRKPVSQKSTSQNDGIPDTFSQKCDRQTDIKSRKVDRRTENG